MRKLALSLAIIIVALLAGRPAAQQISTSAEGRSVFDDYLNPTRSGPGFLSIPGLSFHSSVGFSYASSSRFGDIGMGYYMGNFRYAIGSSVTLDWNVGVGSYMAGPDGMNSYEVFIPNFGLTWRPSESTLVRFQYIRGGYLNPYFFRHGAGF